MVEAEQGTPMRVEVSFSQSQCPQASSKHALHVKHETSRREHFMILLRIAKRVCADQISFGWIYTHTYICMLQLVAWHAMRMGHRHLELTTLKTELLSVFARDGFSSVCPICMEIAQPGPGSHLPSFPLLTPYRAIYHRSFLSNNMCLTRVRPVCVPPSHYC